MYDEEGNAVDSAFTAKDLGNRVSLYWEHLFCMLEESPKYEAILQILQGSWPLEDADKESRIKHDDELVIISNFPICTWLINEVLSLDCCLFSCSNAAIL